MYLKPIAATIAFMIALGGHYLGKLLSWNISKWAIISPASVMIILLGIVFYVRFNGAQSAFVLFFLNVAAGILVTFLSYMRHKDDQYFIPDDIAARLGKEKDRLGRDIINLKNGVEAETQRVYDHWHAKASAFVQAETRRLKKEIANCDKAITAFDNYRRTQVYIPIEAIYTEAIHKLRVGIIQSRKKEGLNLMSFDDIPIKPLVFYKDGGTYKSRQNGWIKGIRKFNILLAVLVVFFLGLMSCDSEAPAPLFKETVYIGDHSIEKQDSAALPSVEDQISFLFTSIDFSPYVDSMAVTRDRIKVTLTHIGATSFPPIFTMELEQGKPHNEMVKSKRRKVQKRFVEEVWQEVAVRSQLKGLSYSYVDACLCQVLVPLVHSSADVKRVLIVSDMILNTPVIGVNFYRMGRRLTDEYDNMVRKLDEACPAMLDIDMSGIQITVVYLPFGKDDDIARHTRTFWTKYINSKGGQIEFLPNLPRAQINVVARE